MSDNTRRVLPVINMSKRNSRNRKSSPVDPRDVPMYTLGQASYVIGVPVSTLDKWFYGRDYVANSETRTTERVLEPADPKEGLLSFTNLGEAHVLESIRKSGFTLRKIRESLELLESYGPHPLVSWNFYQRGRTLWVSHLTSTDVSDAISVSSPTQGQRLLQELNLYLDRIVRDEQNNLVSLFPVRRNPHKTIMSHLHISSGEPIIAERGILAQFVYERSKTGESIQEIAADYDVSESVIEDAIKFVAA